MAFKKEVLKSTPIDCLNWVQIRQNERKKLKDISNGNGRQT